MRTKISGEDADNDNRHSVISNALETRTAKIFLREDGIVQTDLLSNAEIYFSDAVDAVTAGESLCGHGKHPVLVNFGQIKSISREARAYFAGEDTAEMTSAIAIVISSHIGRVIGNFMIGLNKSIYPTRLFNSQEEAVAWLKGFLP